jgi:deoxyribodipyrimidine photo-lyase
MSKSTVLIYLLRRDLRLADNPIFHELGRLQNQSQRPFTHLLPVYVFPAAQVEVSGFLSSSDDKSPYKEARSAVGGFWRCGRLRAKFLAESVWDLKNDLGRIGSDLEIRVGTMRDVVKSLLDGFRQQQNVDVHGLWMTSEEGWEEKIEEKEVKQLMNEEDKEFKLWTDEKYFIDDRDLPFDKPEDLSDVFTTFRKTVEPLRDAPRKQVPKPDQLPPLPGGIPSQAKPFRIPDSLDGTMSALLKPLPANAGLSDMPTMPDGVQSAHPFTGGSKAGIDRVKHLIESGAMTSYKDTRNGLLGLDFSTKLSAWLSLGSISARQVHWMMMDFEDGKTDLGKGACGYGEGENKGTAGVRFELLWRDYMRLCTRKFGTRLFFLDGYRQMETAWSKFISSPFTESTNKKNKNGANDRDTRAVIERFIRGQTGTGLIDASQRELFLTGWTSNRARQNVASYLAKHLGIDWRIGAEW